MYNLNVGAMLVTLALVSAVLGWAVVIAAAAAYKADQAQRACTPLYLQKPKEFDL